MKKYFSQTQAFIFLTIILLGTSCSGQVKKDASKVISGKQQKFIKTQSLNKGDNVHCSLQDKVGNLWFGTTGDGIFIFDPSAARRSDSLRAGGKSFTQFTTTDGLNHNAINHILEDKDGKIWIATDDGVCVYDPSEALRLSSSKPTKAADKTFTKIQMPLPNYTPTNTYQVWSIMQTKNGNLWFATINGVYVYDGKSFTKFKVTEDTSDCFYKIEYIFEDKDGNIWFGGRCNKGVFRYDGKAITNLRLNGDDWAWPVLQDKNGNIWFSSWKGAYRYNPSASLRAAGKSFTTFTKKDGLAGNMVARMIEDKKGNIWIGGEGLSRYDPSATQQIDSLRASGKSFTHYTTKDGLLNESVWAILEDKTGAIWVGTRETGLYRFDGKTFTSYSE
jgi:ligand-binding sensor domain-containing protein